MAGGYNDQVLGVRGGNTSRVEADLELGVMERTAPTDGSCAHITRVASDDLMGQSVAVVALMRGDNE